MICEYTLLVYIFCACKTEANVLEIRLCRYRKVYPPMVFRELGNTGLKVSQLGFGAMRLPMVGDGNDKRVDREKAIPMIHRAFKAGVNYIDSAIGYCNKDSQRAVGDALIGWRDKIMVSTKNHNYGESEQEWWQHLEDSLRRLKVDYIDIYNHHGMGAKRYEEAVKPRVSKWMQKAKEQGLIRHICCSTHDGSEGVIKLVDSGYVDSITCQYNFLDRRNEEGIAYAHKKGVGIVVMGPVGGGRLGVRSEVLEKLIVGVKRVPDLALRFVLSNPNVCVALSGMSTMQQVEENLATAADEISLSETDQAAIEEHFQRIQKIAELYCTGCGYCLPCPRNVAIPKIFERFNLGRAYGLWDTAKDMYSKIGSNNWDTGKKANACVECGKCEEKCPQNIPIIKQLKEAHQALTNSH